MLWNFVGAMNCALKMWICSLNFPKKTKKLWKEVRKIKGNTAVSRYIGGTSILQETVKKMSESTKRCWITVSAKHTLLPLILCYVEQFFLFLWRTLMLLLIDSIRVQSLTVCTPHKSRIQSAVTAVYYVNLKTLRE